jgi:hypothetical protein
VRREYGWRRLDRDVVHCGTDLGSYLHRNQAPRPPNLVWRALPHYATAVRPEGELFPGLIALGLVSAPRHSPADVWLARNASTGLRIRQVGQTRRWFWSVDELSVWEPIG